jgi:hypothetical protein
VTWPHGDPRDVARAILADPRFRGDTDGKVPPPNVLDRILSWLGERLRDLVSLIAHLVGANHPAGVALGTAVLVASAVLVLYLGYRLARTIRRTQHPARTAVLLDDMPTSRELYARALAAARAERWHEAAAALFASALRAFDERGRLPFDPARTAGEARRLVREPAFDELARDGTFALFGRGGADAGRYARMHDAYLRLFGTPA